MLSKQKISRKVKGNAGRRYGKEGMKTSVLTMPLMTVEKIADSMSAIYYACKAEKCSRGKFYTSSVGSI
jgi:hypothetical protein